MCCKIKYGLVGLMFLSGLPFSALAEQITVGILTNSGEQRTFYTTFAREFERRHPDIQVRLDFKSDAEYKELLTQWFESGQGPDVLNWQGGERLYQYVRRGYVADISQLWQQNGLEEKFSPGSKGAVTLDDKKYAIPISYYQWGFYYRKSLFDKLSLNPPQTWQDFLYVCAQLKANDVVPITIGAKYKWPTAAWFDYLNLRVNGLDFHQELLQGAVPFTDQRVRDVMDTWKELLDKGYFVNQYNKWNWSQAMPFLYHKMAGMTLMGNFFAGAMPTHIKDDIRFFRFPLIDSDKAVYEEAPLDVFMLPSYSARNIAAQTFLLEVAGQEFQGGFNEKMGMIPPNMQSRTSDDYFIQQGTRVLNEAAGMSQFFDRDTNDEMAGIATQVFTDFLDNRNIDAALAKLEGARKQFLVN